MAQLGLAELVQQEVKHRLIKQEKKMKSLGKVLSNLFALVVGCALAGALIYIGVQFGWW